MRELSFIFFAPFRLPTRTGGLFLGLGRRLVRVPDPGTAEGRLA